MQVHNVMCIHTHTLTYVVCQCGNAYNVKAVMIMIIHSFTVHIAVYCSIASKHTATAYHTLFIVKLGKSCIVVNGRLLV